LQREKLWRLKHSKPRREQLGQRPFDPRFKMQIKHR